MGAIGAAPRQGMLAQVRGEIAEAAEGAIAEMMFQPLDIGEVIAMAESHELEEIGEQGVALADFFRHAAAVGRQREAAIGLVAQEPELAEAA